MKEVSNEESGLGVCQQVVFFVYQYPHGTRSQLREQSKGSCEIAGVQGKCVRVAADVQRRGTHRMSPKDRAREGLETLRQHYCPVFTLSVVLLLMYIYTYFYTNVVYTYMFIYINVSRMYR